MNTDAIQVFFYGLFMDESLLAAKGVYPTDATIGHVDGFRLHIGQRATLIPNENSRAYGVLMKITPEETAAICYNLPAAGRTAADKDYAAALLALAKRLGLPGSYLEHIRNAAGTSW